jgi:ATP adenylyltransferase/5',5'''-P-1,P-4-tetraphosphate phosphorylase II
VFKEDIDVMIEKEKKKNPNPFFFSPFEKGCLVSKKWKNHILLFNKFYVIPKHLLIVTKKVESQRSLLTKRDFKTTIEVLLSMGENALAWYNHGVNSGGCSKSHKHLSVIPINKRTLATLPLLKLAEELIGTQQITWDDEASHGCFSVTAFWFLH